MCLNIDLLLFGKVVMILVLWKIINKFQQYVVLVVSGFNLCGCVVFWVDLMDGQVEIVLGYLILFVVVSQINLVLLVIVDIYILVDIGMELCFYFRGKLIGVDSVYFILSVSVFQIMFDDFVFSFKSECKYLMMLDLVINDVFKWFYQQYGICLFE